MITHDEYYQIQFCHRTLNMNKQQIARQTGLSPTTVHYWLSQKSYKRKSVSKRTSKLDAFKSRIGQLLAQCPDYSGVQLLHFIKAEGFSGSKTILNDYLTTIRPKAHKAYLSLNFPAGETAQVDWGVAGYLQIGERKCKVSYFVMVLCYSRMMYVRFCLSEAQEFWLSCHRRAFEYFGGIPKKVMVDNCKTAVLSHRPGREIVLNNHYVDFAGHYNFRIVPCNVRQPQEKGRVENGVGYVRKNFLTGRHLAPFELLNIEVEGWLDNLANKRTHGTTGKVPFELLKEEILQKLPLHPYRCSRKIPVRINKLFRVLFDTNTYSVPAEYTGQQAMMEIFPEKILVWCKDRIIAEHQRQFGRKNDYEDPRHASALLDSRKRGVETKFINWLLRISPKAEEFYQKLDAKSLNTTREIRKIAALAQIYSDEEIALALEDALKFSACNAEYIRNIIEQKRQALPEAGPLHVSHNADALHMQLPPPNINIYEGK